MEYVQNCWPEYKEDVKIAALRMYPPRGELSAIDGILTRGDRIAIAHSMQTEIVKRIHEEHSALQNVKKEQTRAFSGKTLTRKSRTLSRDVNIALQRNHRRDENFFCRQNLRIDHSRK